MNNTFSIDELEKKVFPPSDDVDVIVPAFDVNNVAVCIVSSDEYSPFAGVVVHSLIQNSNAKSNYDIVILSDNMTLGNIRRLIGLKGDRSNVSVRVIDIVNMVKGMEFYTWAHFTIKTYYRLLVPSVFKRYEKVVYLDSDIVVNRDIAELYNYDISNYYIAAAYDTHIVGVCQQSHDAEQRIYNRDVLGLENPEEYFQAGVSIYNIIAIRANFEDMYLIKQASMHKLRWLDQDLINKLFNKKIMKLPNKWNVMIANVPYDVREYFMTPELLQEYAEARKDPYIIHYVGRGIPCFTDTPDLYDHFWYYARQTPFYEVILQLMATETVKRTAPLCLPYAGKEKRKKIRRSFRALIDFFLPRGTKRRLFAYNLFVKIRGYGKVSA